MWVQVRNMFFDVSFSQYLKGKQGNIYIIILSAQPKCVTQCDRLVGYADDVARLSIDLTDFASFTSHFGCARLICYDAGRTIRQII